MPAANIIFTNFTAGELSPRLVGRPDLQKYNNAAETILNFGVMPHGGARRRGGTRYVAHVKDSNENSILQKFVFSTTQAYMLEFGPEYIRFFKDRASITDYQVTITGISNANPAVVSAAGHTLTAGQRVVITGVVGMTEVNNREFEVGSPAAGVFSLVGVNSSAYGVYSSGGSADRVYEISTPYIAADLADLSFAQSADTLFIVHPDWPLYKLVRTAHDAWFLSVAEIEEGPFLDINTDMTNTISIDVASGAGIMTATLDTFEVAHEGSLWRIWEKSNGTTFGYARWAPGASVTVANDTFWEYEGNVYYVVTGGGAAMASTAAFPTHKEGTVDVFYGTAGQIAEMRYEHSGFCVVRIDSVIDSKNCNVTIVKNRTPYTAYGARSSAQWQEGAWSDKRGYPRSISFHEQRLLLASSEFQPQTVWGSVSGAYTKFKDGDLDDEAYIYTIAADSVDVIRHLSSGKGLAMFTVGGEYALVAGNPSQPITPTNIKIGRETTFGAAPLKPIRVGPAVIFGQRAGVDSNAAEKIREFVYNFQTDSYTAPDLTILSEHVTQGGVTEGAYQSTPDATLWYVRTDGFLVGLTYERDQQVVAWHRHQFGGTDAKAKHVASMPGIEADEVWLIVEREIDGNTVRTIEWLQPGLADDDDKEDGIFLDCSLTYEGSPQDEISGLWHLNGEEVYALADGAVVGPLTVTDGTITLPNAASTIHIGFNYTSRLKTLRPEAGAAGGTAQGRTKRVNELILRLHRTLGGHFGYSEDRMDEIHYREAGSVMDASPDLYTGDKVLAFDGSFDRDGQVIIEQRQPLPMTVLAVIMSLKVSG